MKLFQPTPRIDFAEHTSEMWMRHMRRGEFEAAWEISDAVLRSRAGVPCRHLPHHLQYVWDGTSLEGKRVLIRCYHGLGDTIQFIRYGRLVKAVAGEVTVSAQAELIALLRTVPGLDRLLPLEAGDADLTYDVAVELMELPHVFRTTLQTIPAQVPYLEVDAASLPKKATKRNVRPPTSEQLAVGIVWAAGDWDIRRSIPFAQLTPLAEIPGIELYILQHGPALAERGDGFCVLLTPANIFETARHLRALDLLISVDTMLAHLAGALCVPVWNLLHADADWRWMKSRSDSPWYPTMRLFRQERTGEWEPVIAAVASGLESLTAGRRLLKKRSLPVREYVQRM